MPDPLKIPKNWTTGGRAREENWDVIRNALAAWTAQINRALEQLGLDIDGIDYQYNDAGRATQTTPMISRIETLEETQAIVGARNLGLDLSPQTKIALVGSDGNALSSSNTGQVTINSTTSPGQLVTRELTSNIEVTLTGAHWGYDGGGDLTDAVLWLLLLDTGSGVILGVASQTRQTVTTADAETAVGNVTTNVKVLTDTAVSAELACTVMGWVKADFDDTGNAGGENYWTVKNAVGDINLGLAPSLFQGEIWF